jgi:hypothetical protein
VGSRRSLMSRGRPTDGARHGKAADARAETAWGSFGNIWHATAPAVWELARPIPLCSPRIDV